MKERRKIAIAAKNTKQTSRRVARKASSLLRDGRTSAKTKSVAASALAQTKPKAVKSAWSILADAHFWQRNLCRIFDSINRDIGGAAVAGARDTWICVLPKYVGDWAISCSRLQYA